MIILQIILVPVFVLILLGIVFIVGVAGVSSNRYDSHDEIPANPAEK